MEHRTRHHTRQTAERHLQRQGFERSPTPGVWRHWGKRLTARIEALQEQVAENLL